MKNLNPTDRPSRRAGTLPFLTFAGAILVGGATSLSAGVVVDKSPEALGGTYVWDYTNQIGIWNGMHGDRFDLSAETTITGGAIFSDNRVGVVGDAVKFLIFSGTPGTTALLDESLSLDLIDTLYVDPSDYLNLTDLPVLNRKHATLSAPLTLAAGTYYFVLAGDGFDLRLGFSDYDADVPGFNGHNWNGSNNNTLTHGGNYDVWFQLDGFATAAIPEPSVLLGFLTAGSLGLLLLRRRRG